MAQPVFGLQLKVITDLKGVRNASQPLDCCDRLLAYEMKHPKILRLNNGIGKSGIDSRPCPSHSDRLEAKHTLLTCPYQQEPSAHVCVSRCSAPAVSPTTTAGARQRAGCEIRQILKNQSWDLRNRRWNLGHKSLKRIVRAQRFTIDLLNSPIASKLKRSKLPALRKEASSQQQSVSSVPDLK